MTLLGIHKNLRLLFPENRDPGLPVWMTTRNKADDNRTPVEVVMKEWGFAGLLMVRSYLDRARRLNRPQVNLNCLPTSGWRTFTRM